MLKDGLELGAVRNLLLNGHPQQFVNRVQVAVNAARDGVYAAVEVRRNVAIRVLDEELGILQRHPNYIRRPLHGRRNLHVGDENDDGRQSADEAPRNGQCWW